MKCSRILTWKLKLGRYENLKLENETIRLGAERFSRVFEKFYFCT